MLRVTLLGNLGGEPEVRFSQKGTQIASFSVAVNQVRTGPDGERQENTEWFRVKVVGRQIDFVQRLSKGSKVLVMGRLDIGKYKSREGDMRTSFDVWADEVQAMASRAFGAEPDNALGGEEDAREPAGVSSLAGATAGRSTSNGKAARASAQSSAPGASASEDLEDLPF